jgi:hypothetical protein
LRYSLRYEIDGVDRHLEDACGGDSCASKILGNKSSVWNPKYPRSATLRPLRTIKRLGK